MNIIKKLLSILIKPPTISKKEVNIMLLTLNQLYQINRNINKAECEYYINALNTILPEYKIDTPLRICHFLAQIIHESDHLKYKSENLNYSSDGLLKTFGKYFKTKSDADLYARNPEKIANRVYANRMGNGNEASGDGWKYRGTGLIQLTGKDNFIACSKALNIDLVEDPALILKDPIINIKVACWFWNSKNLNLLADKDDILSITKKINGGINGLDDRTQILNLAKKIYN